MIHTNLPRNCVVFLLLCELTRSAIYGSQKFDSHKWPTVLVDEVKGKPCNFEACLCGSLYSTFTTSFYPYAFYNKRLQTLFKDQLDRSKATCSFNADTPWQKPCGEPPSHNDKSVLVCNPSTGRTNNGLASCLRTQVLRSELEPTLCRSETPEFESRVLKRSAMTQHNVQVLNLYSVNPFLLDIRYLSTSHKLLISTAL